MDYDSLKDHGTSLGTGAIIVMDQTTDMVAAIARFVSRAGVSRLELAVEDGGTDTCGTSCLFLA